MLPYLRYIVAFEYWSSLEQVGSRGEPGQAVALGNCPCHTDDCTARQMHVNHMPVLIGSKRIGLCSVVLLLFQDGTSETLHQQQECCQ